MSRKSKSNLKGLPRQEYLVCLFLVVMILAGYRQIPTHDFVYFDDYEYIVENPHLREGITVKSIVWAFSSSYFSYWHPLTWLSHMLDYQLFGIRPGMHHLVNLFLHMLNTLVLFLVFKRTTGTLWRSAFVAGLFALHPLNVESVAWVAERKNVLSTFFWMLTMLAYSYYVKSPGLTRYLFIILAFGLGLMAKPMLVTLPFVLLLLDYWPLCRFQSANSAGYRSSGSLKSILFYLKETQVFRLVLEKLPLMGLSAVSIYLSLAPVDHVISSEAVPMGARIANAIVSYGRYIGKAIVPRNLAVFYPFSETLTMWQVIGTGLLLMGGTTLIIFAGRQRPYLTVGWLWFIGTLVPVIGIVQWGLWPAMADRFVYVPLIGLFILFSWGLADIFTVLDKGRVLFILSAVIILSTLTICTFFQVRHWKNSISLFEHTSSITDNNWVAHNNLAAALADVEKYDQAIFHFKKALAIQPEHEKIYYNLATALAKKENFNDAGIYYRKALKINPEYPEAHSNLANMLFTQGKFDEAFSHYTRALQLNSEYADAHYNLGSLLMHQGQFKEALIHFAETIKIDSGYVKAYNKIGIVMAELGEIKKADEFFTRAVQLDPEYFEARKNRAILRRSSSP